MLLMEMPEQIQRKWQTIQTPKHRNLKISLRKTKNKNLRRALGFLLLVALVAGLAAMPLLTADKVPEAEFPLSVLRAEAERRELLLDLRSGGTLIEEEAVTVTVPSEVKLTAFLVKNGDAVKEGDPKIGRASGRERV